MAAGSGTRDDAEERELAERPRRPAGPVVLVAGVVALALVVAAATLLTGLLLRAGDGQRARATTPSASASQSAATTVSDVFTAVAPSVVVLRTADGALGTGTVVADDGTILTADHVVDDGSAVSVTFADGTSGAATVLAADPVHDVATLRPQRLPEVLVPAVIGGGVAVGGDVVAIGNPLGLTYSVSSGVVSGLDRTTTGEGRRLTGLVQFDASVNPGSSGGPLLDGDGLLVGVVVAIADPGGDEAFAGIGFAVPIGAALAGGAGDGPGGGPQI